MADIHGAVDHVYCNSTQWCNVRTLNNTFLLKGHSQRGTSKMIQVDFRSKLVLKDKNQPNMTENGQLLVEILQIEIGNFQD